MNPIKHAPGVLCYLTGIRPPLAQNNGKVVELIRRHPEWDAYMHAPAWEARAKTTIIGREGYAGKTTDKYIMCQKAIFPQNCLCPIADPSQFIDIAHLVDTPSDNPVV